MGQPGKEKSQKCNILRAWGGARIVDIITKIDVLVDEPDFVSHAKFQL